MELKESKKIDKYRDLARELKKSVECKDDSDTSHSQSLWKNPEKHGKVTGGTEDLEKD